MTSLEMVLQQCILSCHPLFSPPKQISLADFPSVRNVYPAILRKKQGRSNASTARIECSVSSLPTCFQPPLLVGRFQRHGLRASKKTQMLKPDDSQEKKVGESSSSEHDDEFMDEEQRKEWRREIRQVIDMNPHVDEEVDPLERRNKMQKLLEDYPLVVEEDDPDWPEDADGWGFNLGQFFNKISIKNVKKDDDDNYDRENELVWQDDDYIRPIKDITSAEWEETVFKDISPLVVLVHNRYKRPKENEKIQNELEKAVQSIWNCGLPSPRCVAIDAVVELELVSTLQVSIFPELIFTKAGKILYREKAMRTADELSKIMAFFYYGAAKPSSLNWTENSNEAIPMVSIKSQQS